MRLTTPAVALAALAAFATSVATLPAAHAASDTAQPRIVGGTELGSVADNPGAVGVHTGSERGTSIICGGTRIHPLWVITAKHCNDKGLYNVSSSTLAVSKGPRIRIASATPHPGKVDLLLIKLTEAGPGRIATWSDAQPAAGDTISAYGWGLINQFQRAKNLKKATGTVARIAPNPLYPEATDIVYKPGDGLCWQGDSGGPLLNATGQLVGVSSWSNGYGTMKGECGYVSLAAHKAWITEVTGLQPNIDYPAIPAPPAPSPSQPAVTR